MTGPELARARENREKPPRMDDISGMLTYHRVGAGGARGPRGSSLRTAGHGEVFHVDERRQSHEGEPVGEPARPRAGPSDDRCTKMHENARSPAIVSTRTRS